MQDFTVVVQLVNSCTGRTCGLPGCGKPCHIEQNGTVHDFCCKSHADESHQAAMPPQMIPPQPMPQLLPTVQNAPFTPSLPGAATVQTTPFAPSVPGTGMVQTTPAPFTQTVPEAATNTSNCHTVGNIYVTVINFIFSHYCGRSGQMCYSRVSQPMLCG